MSRLSVEAGLAHIELNQLVVDFFEEIDVHHGLEVTRFYAEDGILYLGDFTFKGREAIGSFYRNRLEKVRAEQKDGVRTARHAFSNFRAALAADGSANIKFLNTQYSGEGNMPVAFDGPTSVVDCRMACSRDAEGRWLIKEFRGTVVFAGKDPFLNKMLMKR